MKWGWVKMKNETLDYALKSMCLLQRTHVVIRTRDKEGVHPIGGGIVPDVLSRYGHLIVTRSMIVDNMLYVDVQ